LSLARPTIRVTFCLALALLAGCKSGVERDVVQREMRQQEDQIYAMQDYISEYQQLLCDARSENASLKRQMAKGQFREGSATGTSDDANTLPSSSDASPSTPASTEPEIAPATITPPDVPPLDLTAPPAPSATDSSQAEPDQLAHEVQQASAEMEIEPEAEEQDAAQIALEVVPETAAAVVLRGEVQISETENGDPPSGPRVLAQVEPLTVDGKPTNFRGRLSILVLDPAARGKEQQLARWDFDAATLAPLAQKSDGGSSFEFPLQLPPGAPTSRPLELWVRLLPEDGEKVLARSMIDLSRDGQFASADVKPAPTSGKQRQPVELASAEVPVEATTERPQRIRSRHRNSRDLENGWTIARPGERPESQAAAKSASDWKIATRPVPEVESTPIVDSSSAPRNTPSKLDGDRYEVATAPEWAPERSEGDNAVPSAEPTWSPTR
jgi:hypothetical protein